MKEFIENLLKVLPQPLLVAVLGCGAVYFAVYYHYGYASHQEAFRDTIFRSLSVVILACTLLFMINRSRLQKPTGIEEPVLVLPLFANDPHGQFGAAFRAALESVLDSTLGRPRTVFNLGSFISEESAQQTMEHYGASAIMYDPVICSLGDDKALCFNLCTQAQGVVPRFAPVILDSPDKAINELVLHICGKEALDSGVAAKSPLLAKLLDLESRLGQIETTIRSPTTRPAVDRSPFYRKRIALLVGLNSFAAGKNYKLRFAESDAQALAATLRNRYGFDVTLLLGANATRNAIASQITAALRDLQDNDLFLFYFTGNMTMVSSKPARSEEMATLVPYDFHPETCLLTNSDLVTLLDHFGKGHRLAVLDGCHAAAGLVSSERDATSTTLPSESVLQVFAGARAHQVSYEVATVGGVFSHALIRVLNENAEAKGSLWMSDVAVKVRSVIENENTGFSQTPQLITVSGNGEILWQSELTGVP